MKTRMQLDERTLSMKSGCAKCGTEVTVFEFEIPGMAKNMLGMMGVDISNALGTADAPEVDAVLVCGPCARELTTKVEAAFNE